MICSLSCCKPRHDGGQEEFVWGYKPYGSGYLVLTLEVFSRLANLMVMDYLICRPDDLTGIASPIMMVPRRFKLIYKPYGNGYLFLTVMPR